MSANPNQVSDDPESAGELPTPSFSSESASSPSDNADVIVGKLTPLIEQLIERKVQSTKDKRFSELEKALGGRSKLLAELESEGVSIPKEVRSELRIRELEERLAEPTAQPVPVRDNGLSQQRAAVTDAIAELKKYELDENDTGFIELLRGKYANRAEFDLKVSQHVVKKLSPQKPANPADLVQSPSTMKTAAGGSEIITAYEKELAAIPRGSAHTYQRTQLKVKYAKLAREKGFTFNE
ncbi:MAG: hypothetical protein M3R47_20990 [Chloroflexota bacterium]|nr:hypothetical protein [Chloroflexota bacterium]